MPRKQAWEKNIEASGGREAVVGKCRRYAEHVARMVQDERFPTLQLYALDRVLFDLKEAEMLLSDVVEAPVG
jgi:hypothetical protein